ncbi:MAG TPA: hypothetical protein VIC83_03300 [Candidatus Limnocylindria bacterium]|jgi:hypothetical protein
MTRTTWFALSIAALLILVAGTALGTQALGQGRGAPGLGERQADAAGSEALFSRLVDRLHAAGVETSTEELDSLADSFGVGGAVRIVIWADATDASVDEIVAMREAGAGWGEIGRTLGVRPGLGWMMGGHGGHHGRDHAPGQQKPKHHDDQDREPDAAEASPSPAD